MKYSLSQGETAISIAAVDENDPRRHAGLDMFTTEEGRGFQGNDIENCWTISRIIVTPSLRREGVARELMQRACQKADGLHINLELEAVPYAGQDGPTQEQLIAFFKEFGFESQSNYAHNMVRLYK